jgi:uncharacterized protein
MRAIHAVSPAVPQAATSRVQALAEARGWRLTCVDAGEFADADYLRNPVNRCFFCKTNLYASLGRVAGPGALMSGTNTDDLGDYRPGLRAAADHGVRHPYVEARCAKTDVRALARALGLGEVADLPAAPCLSSRIETGLMIDADELALVDRVERWLTARLGPGDLRCRILHDAVELQITPGPHPGLIEALCADIPALVGRALRIGAYRKGSAFVGDKGARHG